MILAVTSWSKSNSSYTFLRAKPREPEQLPELWRERDRTTKCPGTSAEIYCNEYQKGGSGADAEFHTPEEHSGMRDMNVLCWDLSLMRRRLGFFSNIDKTFWSCFCLHLCAAWSKIMQMDGDILFVMLRKEKKEDREKAVIFLRMKNSYHIYYTWFKNISF